MSFTERAGLVPVLLLTGCAQPAVYTEPPSGSVVDGILSRSAADISAMQYRLHQSSPSAQRPTSPSDVKTQLQLYQPSDGFVRQAGAAPTLRSALSKIVPSGYSVVFDKGVFADTPELWQWPGNDRWPFVVDKLLATRGMKATVNTKTGTVTVESAQRAQTARKVDKVMSYPVQSSPSVDAVKASPQRSNGRNPFRGDATTKEIGAVSAPASPVASRVPIPRATPPKTDQVKHWHIETGNTVKDWLYSQAASETCTAPGIKNWTIAWLTPTNYRVDAPLNFDGSFREMLNQLFILYGTAKVPLYAGSRAAQCVVSVDDKEVH